MRKRIREDGGGTSSLSRSSGNELKVERRSVEDLRREGPVFSSATETEDDNEEDVEDAVEGEPINSSSLGTAAAASFPAAYLRREAITPTTSSTVPPQLEADRPLSQWLLTFRVRVVWTLILIGGFLIILCAGHFYSSLLVLVITTLVYREIIALKRNTQKDEKLPLFFSLRWYWFFLTIYSSAYTWLLPLADSLGIARTRSLELLVTHHLLIVYLGAFLGVTLFVASLRRFSLRYQFSQFGILLLTCLLVVGQTLFQIANIYSGLIWFVLASSTVILNDCSAYLFGSFFGRRRLFRLSPKKTIEGFIGASVVTVLFAVVLCEWLANYPVLTSPQTKIVYKPFAMWFSSDSIARISHSTNAVFEKKTYVLPATLVTRMASICTVVSPVCNVLARIPTSSVVRVIWENVAENAANSTKTVTVPVSLVMRPAIIHAFVIGCFAAFCAPFGGFFASALKRALRIKDFGASIPGHGGITDRFDCQILMGSFTFLYLRTFIFKAAKRAPIYQILKMIKQLNSVERSELCRYLANEGVMQCTALAGTLAAVAASAYVDKVTKERVRQRVSGARDSATDPPPVIYAKNIPEDQIIYAGNETVIYAPAVPHDVGLFNYEVGSAVANSVGRAVEKSVGAIVHNEGVPVL